MKLSLCAGFLLLGSGAVAQTFQRLGGCGDKLGCIFPPDQYALRSIAALQWPCG